MVYTLEMAPFSDPDRLAAKISDMLSRKFTGMVIDMKNVNFILSSCITQIVKLYRHCNKKNIPFKIINASKVYNTFDALRLTSLFEVWK